MAKYLIHSCRRMCSILVDNLTKVDGGLHSGIHAPREGPWQSSVKCGENARRSGCSLCKVKVVETICGATQVARRVLDMDTNELARMARVRRGSWPLRQADFGVALCPLACSGARLPP